MTTRLDELNRHGEPLYKVPSIMKKWRCPHCGTTQIKSVEHRLINTFQCIKCNNIETVTYFMDNK